MNTNEMLLAHEGKKKKTDDPNSDHKETKKQRERYPPYIVVTAKEKGLKNDVCKKLKTRSRKRKCMNESKSQEIHLALMD